MLHYNANKSTFGCRDGQWAVRFLEMKYYRRAYRRLRCFRTNDARIYDEMTRISDAEADSLKTPANDHTTGIKSSFYNYVQEQ
jgi:hypothetical protein